MTTCFMYGADAAFEIDDRPTCDCCRRKVDRVRGSMWHGTSRICPECLIEWYDGAADPTNPVAIGNAVRARHGLPPVRDAECDCQNPDGPPGVRHVSMECAIHNENPSPRDGGA